VSLQWLFNHSHDATFDAVGQFPESDFEAHAEALSFDVFIVDSVFHEFAVEGELADSAADGADDLADAVAGACDYRPEEGNGASSVPSCLELVGELGGVSQDVEA
jgi:hypothetical protein